MSWNPGQVNPFSRQTPIPAKRSTFGGETDRAGGVVPPAGRVDADVCAAAHDGERILSTIEGTQTSLTPQVNLTSTP